MGCTAVVFSAVLPFRLGRDARSDTPVQVFAVPVSEGGRATEHSPQNSTGQFRDYRHYSRQSV